MTCLMRRHKGERYSLEIRDGVGNVAIKYYDALLECWYDWPSQVPVTLAPVTSGILFWGHTAGGR